MQYDTFMSDRSPVKVRSLADGVVLDAWESGWDENLLHLILPEGQAGFSPGVLAEIESASGVYFGEIRQCSGSVMRVLVEHSLDRVRLASMQGNWR